MAVHVVRNDGNDWKTQLAATALSWIGDAIKQSRQSTENAKQAILLDQVLNGGGGGQTQTTPQPTGTQSGDTSLLGGSQLGSITAPNRDGWGEAFRSGGNPLAGFDAGISSVLPSSAQGLGTQSSAPSTQSNIPTQTEMLQRIAAAYANPRFSKWLNPKTVNELFTPYMQANEAARLEQRKKEFIDKLGTAGVGTDEWLSNLYAMQLQGLADSSTLQQGQGLYQHKNPHLTPYTHNTGPTTRYGGFNPATGAFTQAGEYVNGLTPQEVLQGQQWDRTFERQGQQWDRTFERQGQQWDRTFEQQGRQQDREYQLKQEIQAWEREKFQLQTASTERIAQWKAEAEARADIAGHLTTQKKNEADMLLKQIENIDADITRLQTQHDAETNAETRESLLKQINELRRRKLLAIDAMFEIYCPKPAPTYISAGAAFLGVNPGGQSLVSKNGEYLNDRSTHRHEGTDYAYAADSPVIFPKGVTDDGKLKVIHVKNDKDGYGNYIVLEGTYKGQRVEYLFAHLQDGAPLYKIGNILSEGDVIGRVGSTGRSSGPHLHIEVRTGGQLGQWRTGTLQNPERFFSSSSSSTTSTAPQEQQGQGQQPPQGQQRQGQQRQGTQNPYSAGGYGSGYPAFIYPNYSVGQQPQGPQAPQQSQTPTSGDIVPQTTSGDRTILPPSPASGDVPVPTSRDITAQSVSGDVPAPTSGDRAILPPSPASGDVTAPNAASITSGDTAPEVTGTSFMGVDLPGLNPSGAPSASTTPMGMTGGAPTPQAVDPDGGLTSYRVPNDNSPVTWVNANGKPMLTSDRQLFTRQVYEDLAQQADAGHFRDRGISNRADLDKWLQSVGMRPNNPSEQRGINALNGDAARTIDIADPAITPTVQTPRDNPDRYPAPEFTDRINGTTPEALQGQLNALNGLTDDRYSQWTRALRGLPPSYGADGMRTLLLTPEDEMRSRVNGLLHYFRTGDRYGLQGGRDALYRVGYDGPPIDPNNPTEGQPLTPLGLDRGTTPTPNSGVTPFSLSGGTAPEETGTTFGGIELPGLEQPGEMTASRRPMGRGRPRRRAAPAPTPRRRAAPRRGGTYTSYEEQRAAVDGSARRHGVAPELVRAVIQAESSWRPNISGPKTRWGRAKGLMQLMDGAARELGVRNPYDPAQNIEGGTKYLARLIRRYKGDISKALMAYNCGPGNVDKGRIPRASRDYARKVLSIYRQLGGR